MPGAQGLNAPALFTRNDGFPTFHQHLAPTIGRAVEKGAGQFAGAARCMVGAADERQVVVECKRCVGREPCKRVFEANGTITATGRSRQLPDEQALPHTRVVQPDLDHGHGLGVRFARVVDEGGARRSASS